ncbi:MAG: B12-binding domain-containing radical SAM protein [Elusimicrobia bacterium]|nr:B12-binding domain-containing radical SAM protein [Elusimicrobiota bacterium]
MKKILFINPPFFRLVGQTYIYLPLGICSLAAVTRSHRYETAVYNMDLPPLDSALFRDYQDLHGAADERDLILMNLRGDPLGVWQELKDVLRDYAPEVVGITALTPQIPLAEKVADICKAHDPAIATVVGGPHATFLPGQVLGRDSIDFVFSGEAEDGIIGLLKALESGGKAEDLDRIKGLSHKRSGRACVSGERPIVDVNAYPMPARESFLFPERLQPKNMAMLLTGRGCYFRCKFCSSPAMSGFKVRQRTMGKIADEVEHIYRTYQAREFMFWEDTFVSGKTRISEFRRLLKERGLDIAWRCHTRLDTLNEDIVDMLLDGGCRQITVGVETGSERMLKYMDKRISRDKIIEKISILRRKGIIWSANFMIGYPEETPADIEETIAFIRDTIKNHIAINICIPYPGTRFFDDCAAMGLIDRERPIDWTLFNPQSKYARFTKHLDHQRLLGYLEEIREAVKPYMRKTPGAFSPCERA